MTDSDTSSSIAVVLKRDERGRVRTTAAQRVALLAEYERSGLSGPAFARVAGINYQTFAWWRQAQRKAALALVPAARPAVEQSLRLVEAMLPATTPLMATHVRVQVVLPGGASVDLTDAAHVALVAQLIKALV